jgi:hypothetical protein
MKASASTMAEVLARALELCRDLSFSPECSRSVGTETVIEGIRRSQGNLTEIAGALEAVAMRLGPLGWGAAMEGTKTGEEIVGGVSTVAAEARSLARKMAEIAVEAEAVSRRLDRIADGAEGAGSRPR